MKKTIKSLVAISILFLTMSVQNAKAQETKMDSWPEMKAFHEVMSQTFHPAEEGNLEPIKAMSTELSNRATAWLESTPPNGMASADVKTQLKALASGCANLDKMIHGGVKDEEIKASLTKLHEQFHAIVGACMKEVGEKAKTKSTTAPKKTTTSPAKTK